MTAAPQHSEEDLRARARGAHAATLLEDEILSQAFKAQREEYIELLEHGADLRKPGEVIEVIRCLRAVGKAQDHLKSIVNGGKAAKTRLDAVDKALSVFRRKVA